ncbi:MAG: hypothetical protein QOI95_240 [Acidimicrobiaceae bacterium]|jgi:hypothetical protein
MAAVVFCAGVLAAIVHVDHNGPPHPKEWDPRVLDIVHFDEQHRGLTFKQPVFVDFLDAKAYSDRVRTDETDLTDEDKQQLKAAEGELRALGLSNSSVDLFAASNELVDTGTLAFYDPTSERVIIRGTEMTVDLRVTLVHEFTHVLQDQHFGVGRKRTSKFSTSQQSSAFRAVVEGDAVRIEGEYIDSLSVDDKAQYEQLHQQEVESATTGLSDVPVALQALQAAPYLLGPPFVELLDAKGHQSDIDNAFRTPPTTDEQVYDPRAFLRNDKALDVAQPVLPGGVPEDKQVDSGDFGAISWLLVLGERIDPLVALQAVDGWGGDAYVAYEQDGKTCVRLNWQGDSSTDDQEMHDALDQWVAAMPAGAASVRVDGALLLVEACDPGVDSSITLNNRAIDVLQLPATRSALAVEAAKQGGLAVDKALAFGDCFVRTLGFDQLTAANHDLTPEVQGAINTAIVDCRSKAGG